MSIWDDLSGAWDDLNTFIQPAVDAINPIARDVIPLFGAAEDIFGIGPGTAGYGPAPIANNGGSLTGLARPQTAGGGIPVFAGGQAAQGGASMSYDLTAAGQRSLGLVPFSGQGPPAPGYHLARRPQRNAFGGRAAGMYWVPRRTMNPLNPRALMRAERRMAGFTKFVKRHFHLASIMPKRKKSTKRGCYTRRRK